MADIDLITNPEAKRFIVAFLSDRNINAQFYRLVPEESFDFRMVDTPKRKSDSPRESLMHQIDTTRDYINGLRTGTLTFMVAYPDLADPLRLTKNELLEKLDATATELISALADPDIGKKQVRVPWSREPIPVLTSLWGLDSHEILHTGWNLAIMDHLNIPRFPELKDMWG